MDTILIVDDDAQVQSLLKKYLEGKGYRILTAPDGWDAVRQLVSEKPDLVVMDINMPKMGGLNALQFMRDTQVALTTPILIASSQGDQATILQAAKLGADDFVVKPYSFGDLAARIHTHLFRLDHALVNQILESLQKSQGSLAHPPHFPAPFLTPGATNTGRYADWTAYPIFYQEKELCVLLQGGVTLEEALKFDPETAAQSVVVLVKYRLTWKCCWPGKAGEVAQIKKAA